MKLKVGSSSFTIDPILIQPQTFLDTLSDYDETIPLPPRITEFGFRQFIKFLHLDNFFLDEDIAEEFDFLGYPNVMKYPLDYWKIKLHDNLLRDFFYKLNLYEDPIFDLVDITNLFTHEDISKIYNYRKFLDEDMYIAGGSLISILKNEKVKDIDIFVVGDKDECQMKLDNFINKLVDYSIITFTKNSVSIRYYDTSDYHSDDSDFTNDDMDGEEDYYQVILRSYRS